MFKRIKRTSLILGITLTAILGMSYGTFIFTTNSYRSTEMLVSNLTYGIEITSTGGSETINGTSVSFLLVTIQYYLHILLTQYH